MKQKLKIPTFKVEINKIKDSQPPINNLVYSLSLHDGKSVFY